MIPMWVCGLLVVFSAWVCGFVIGGVAGVGVGVGLLVVFPAWVCGFDGGAASVGVWV